MKIKEYAKKMIEEQKVFADISQQKETLWINEEYLPFADSDKACSELVSDADIEDAAKRLERFAPYICKCFPETEKEKGLIESPLREIEHMRELLCKNDNPVLAGRLFLKMDSHLAIAGSVKARGGIYEVLKHAENLALEAGKISEQDNYERFADPDMRDFFAKYTIQVGSTGNLGLSIGIMSAHLGFRVKVHMSADAREWKKQLLRSKGVEVIEYEEDYSKAVEQGRYLSSLDPFSYFVDDEHSKDLFLGYAVGAKRLQKQLAESGISVDDAHPLVVYIPCGVGGAPGGICYGLKRIFQDHVHVFFCEPTLFPSVLLGMASGRFEEVNVADFGISGMSAADGLACASPSGFVTRIDRHLVSGDFTVGDRILFDYMRGLEQTENIFIEPSSCAAFQGPAELMRFEQGRKYLEQHFSEQQLANTTHICWATGGSLVPEEEREKYRKMNMD